MTILQVILTVGVLAMSSNTVANAEDVVLDTSFAVAYSRSCLSGGCHEQDKTLVKGYAQSYMTHIMVKCNACHGTHTKDEVGKPKPNLTGYLPGMGPTGYTVGRDRCLACHSEITRDDTPHPRKKTDDCNRCHAPHVFALPSRDK